MNCQDMKPEHMKEKLSFTIYLVNLVQ